MILEGRLRGHFKFRRETVIKVHLLKTDKF